MSRINQPTSEQMLGGRTAHDTIILICLAKVHSDRYWGSLTANSKKWHVLRLACITITRNTTSIIGRARSCSGKQETILAADPLDGLKTGEIQTRNGSGESVGRTSRGLHAVLECKKRGVANKESCNHHPKPGPCPVHKVGSGS